MNMNDTPLSSASFPLRVVKGEDGLYEVWTAQDDRISSLNNFAIASQIQTQRFAHWICNSLNERKP